MPKEPSRVRAVEPAALPSIEPHLAANRGRIALAPEVVAEKAAAARTKIPRGVEDRRRAGDQGSLLRAASLIAKGQPVMNERQFQAFLKDELARTREIVATEQAARLQQEVREHTNIFMITADFIKERHLIVFGGMAINQLLPSKYKFYQPEDFPDIDCMSPNAKKDIEDLQKLLTRNGYDIKIKTAIHENTYKLYHNHRAFVDISLISRKTYKRLVELAELDTQLFKLDTDMILAPVILLKANFYHELSNPQDSIGRWEKVFKRAMLFNHIYPLPRLVDDSCRAAKTPSRSRGLADTPDTVRHAYQTVLSIIREHGYPIVGHAAIAILKGYDIYNDIATCRWIDNDAMIDIIAHDDDHVVQNIYKRLRENPIFGKEIYMSDKTYISEIVPRRVNIFYKLAGKKIRIVRIFMVEKRCYTILPEDVIPVAFKGYNVGSYDTILTMMYKMLLMYMIFAPEKISGVLRYIQTMEQYVLTVYKRPDHRRISVSCPHII